MNTFRRSSLVGIAALLSAASLFSSTSLAQSTPALKGPEVKDRDVPGVVGSFGSGGEAAQRRFANRLPPEAFRKALGVLTAADAPAGIRATDDQRRQFKELVDEFEGRVRQYRKDHAKDMAELRKLAGEIDGPGSRDAKRPNADRSKADESMSKMSEEDQKKRDEARAKLRELMEGAPKIEDVYTKVWAGLSEPQRKAVDGELDTFRADQAKQREDQYVRQRVKKKEPNGPSPAAPEAMKDGGDREEMMKPSPVDEGPRRRLGERISPERRERLMRIFEQLSPEEQDQLLQRLEARVKDAAGVRRPEEAGNGRRNAKPAPNPDDVKVPEPSDKK